MFQRAVDIAKMIRQQYLISPSKIWKNISWRINATVSEEPYIFICGAPRSGTTLLQAILNSHNQLCGFQYETAIFTRQNIFNARRYQLSHGKASINELFISCKDVVSFYDQFVLEVKDEDCQRVIEKTPQHINRISFILKHFTGSQIIHVHRDGRDAYCSARHHDGVIQGKGVSRYAKYWCACIEARKSVAQHDRVYDLSYEMFSRDPEGEIQSLVQFLGINYEPCILDPINYGMDIRAESEYFKGMKKPINSRSAGRWKTEMTPWELARFEKIAGDQLVYLGYDLHTVNNTREQI